MMCCKKIPKELTERWISKHEAELCGDVGLYIGVTDKIIHGYCFNQKRAKENQCPKKGE